MIVQSYPAKKQLNTHLQSTVLPPRKPLVVVKPPQQQNSFNQRQATAKEIMAATKLGIGIEVFLGRDNVIKMNAKGCPFKVGEVVEPRMPSDKEMWGQCRILALIDNYLDFGDEEWPASNVPRIVHFEPVEPTENMKNKHFFATINFFERALGKVC